MQKQISQSCEAAEIQTLKIQYQKMQEQTFKQTHFANLKSFNTDFTPHYLHEQFTVTKIQIPRKQFHKQK